MLIPVPPSECMRAREAASARLDGELPELDALRLDAHLRRCPACREFAAHADAFAAELRRAPLEKLGVPAFEPRRRRTASALRLPAAAAAAAAVVVAAVGGSFALERGLRGGSGSPTLTASSAPAVSGAQADAFAQHEFPFGPVPQATANRALRTSGPIAV